MTKNQRKQVLAIDGVAGGGKGTAAKEVARRLGFDILDSGALYRLVTLECILQGVTPDDRDRATEIARTIDIKCAPGGKFFLFGSDATEEIRRDYVNDQVKLFSQIQEVRDAVGPYQLAFIEGENNYLVADGRDMWQVFQEYNPLCFYLDASPGERARRRHRDHLLDPLKEQSIARIFKELKQRDHEDMTREVSPLVVCEGAIKIDNSCLTISQTADRIVEEYLAAHLAGKWST
jgi:cytidylate kinase